MAISNTPYAEPSMTPSQATQIVNSVGIDPNAVLSAGNIAQTINNPAPVPTDLLGIRQAIYKEKGIDTAQSAYDTSLGAVNTATANLKSGLQQLSNRPVSLSKITGQQAQLREVAGNEIQALTNEANLKLNTLNALKSEADAEFAIREGEISQIRSLQAQYPGAKIKFGDSFDKAIKRIEKYTEKEQKKSEKKALKETAKSLGIEVSGLSRKELEREIGKINKEALERTKKMQDIEMQTAQAKLNEIKSGGSGGDSDINAYVDAYTKGQIAITNVPQKIRDEVLAQSNQKITENNKYSLTSDISQYLSENSSTNYDTLFNVAKSNYPGLSDQEIDAIARPQYESWYKEEHPIKNWWNNLWN